LINQTKVVRVAGLPSGRSISAFGQHIEWDDRSHASLAANWTADLLKGTFAETQDLGFFVRLDCEGSTDSCAADGDIIETVFTFTSVSERAISTTATVRTNVEALVSCNNTMVALLVGKDLTVWAGGSGGVVSVPMSSPIRLILKALDVDQLPVTKTRASVEFRVGQDQRPVKWARGSNEYVVDVSPALTQDEGEFLLTVNVTSAWSRGAAGTVGCELLPAWCACRRGSRAK
jgi:hypothetical protein